MSLGSLVWDASATMIDVPLENALNMHSVWTARFQFWGKQLLNIDVLFLRYILNVQHSIEWVQLDRLNKKALTYNDTSSLHFVCQAAWRTPKMRRGERVIEPIKYMRSPHTSYRWRVERVIETIEWMRSPHTSYRWRGERVIDNQVYALTTHQLQVERRESHRANQVYGDYYEAMIDKGQWREFG